MDWRYGLFVRLRHAFRRERILSRLMAAWCAVAAVILLDTRATSFAQISFAHEASLGTIALGTLAFFAVFSLIAMIWDGIHSDSWLMLLAATLCVTRWMLAYPEGENQFLFALAVCLAYSMFVIYFLRANRELFARWQPRGRTVLICASVAGILSFAMIAVIGYLRYRTYSTPNFDFGIFCNAFYNMKESGLPITGCERNRLLSHFAVHVSPVFYLVLPIYWLFPSPITLQVVQALALAAGVIPVVLLARHHKLSGKVTILMAVLYAFYPVLTTGCFYDFHENCFLPLFLLLTFLFYEKKRYLPMYVSALCVLSVKEDAAIYLLLFALYILISERAYLHGAILAAISVGYFLLCAHLLKTNGEGMMSNRFENLIYDQNDGLIGAVRTVLANPGYFLTQVFGIEDGGGFDKLVYALQMLLPLGFLPFCAKKPSRWLLLSPILFNLATQYLYQYDIGFQYHFGITAFLFWAAIKNLPELNGETRRTLSGIAAAACLCLYLMNVLPFLNHYRELWRDYKDDYRAADALLETVPEEASVAASTFLLPHLASREVIYETHYHGYKTDVDYVALDLRNRVEQARRDLYLAQGHTVWNECGEWIVILQSPSMAD